MQLSEAALRWLNDLSGQGILMTDADLNIRGWNHWLESYSGKSAAEMIGRNLLDAYPDLITRRLDEYYKDALACQVRIVSQRLHGYLLPMAPCIEGSALTYMQQSARIAPLVEDGRAVGTITVIDDVTERVERENRLVKLLEDEKAARAEAEEGKRILHALMEHIPEGITITDAPGVKIRLVSRYGEEFIGRSAETAEGIPLDRYLEGWSVLRPGEGEQPAIDDLPLSRASRRGEVITDEEWVLQRGDGEKYTILCNAGPIRDHEGNIIGGVIAWRDITDRKKAEVEREQLLAREQIARSEAEAANRAKDEFLATVSHELRTPLNAILGWVQLLQAGKFDKEFSAHALEAIERSAKAQTRIIEDILDASRIITGKFRLEVLPIDLVAIIESALDTMRPAADAKAIQIETAFDSTVGPVSGDPNRLQQVIWNLLNNAIKFTPKGGRIELRLQRTGSQVEFTIRDSGQGINPKFLPHVFDRFRQADSTSSRSHGGLGLGLAIVRHLVELHGGSVQADSDGEGRGSTFTVRLPLMAIDRLHNSAASGDGPSDEFMQIASDGRPRNLPSLDNLRVLVVDDEMDARDMLKQMLMHCGAEIRTAGTAREAIEALEQWQPDVLVSDIGMPEEDGYSLISKLRALEPESVRRIPAVALTGYASPEDRLRLLSAGYQVHVTKPVELAELAAVVATLAGRPSKSVNA